MENEIVLELNDKQVEAVKHTEGYLRVIAGAGSGKTKLLVSRYAYLVKECGIDSANILCVTFTNKAAAEMKKRIRAIIGDEYDTSLICTYHGFCVRVLREDIEKLFYPKGFQVLDESMQKTIIQEIYQKYELKFDYASFSKTLHNIHFYKAKNKDYVSKMCDRNYCQILDDVSFIDNKVIEDYLQKEKNIFGLDFDDLIYFTLYLFYKFDDVLNKWKDKLNYIQVDEFQDSSNIEMQLIDMISDQHKNLMIVGDPDQNIYEWRGSDVKLLVSFDETHEPCKTVLLTQNYRSTKSILKVANTLIDVNKYRIKKDLFTLNDSNVPVIHFHTKNEYDEADKIADKIYDMVRKESVRYNQIAVLYRSSYLSRIIEKKFTEKGLPYEIYGGVKFYQRMEILDIMAYLRLIAFDDDMSLKRIINTPRRQFGRTKLSKLVGMQLNKSLFNTLKSNYLDICGENPQIISFIDMIDEFRNNMNRKKISEMIEDVCHKTGYEKYIRELGDDERFDNLTEFKRIANEYERNYGEDITLEDFVNQISIQSNENNEEDLEQIKLMTIHAAKGLEFDNVFVIGFSEGIFPSPKTIEERKEMGLEEERRLCYVALTRARKRLFMTDSEGFTQGGKQKYPSRFLFEMGEENYERIGAIPNELIKNTKRIMTGENIEEETDCKQVGDTVEHRLFGIGAIIEVNKNRRSYKIKFDNFDTARDVSMDYFNENNKGLKIETSKSVNNNNESDNENNEFKTEEETEPIDDQSIEDTNELRQYQNANHLEDKIIKSVIKDVNDNNFKEVKKQSNNTNSNSDLRNKNKNIDWDDFEKDVKLKVKKEKPNLKDYSNLWEDPNVPKTGWACVGITDLGGPYGVCEMCGKQIIRYVHHMEHPSYRSLGVGCVCAGKMEGDMDKASNRENEFKKLNNRLLGFLQRKWKKSIKGNRYLKYNDHIVVLFYNYDKNKFKYSIDGVIAKEDFDTAREAKKASFYKINANDNISFVNGIINQNVQNICKDMACNPNLEEIVNSEMSKISEDPHFLESIKIDEENK